jgi:hypothetical protein
VARTDTADARVADGGAACWGLNTLQATTETTSAHAA